MALCSAEWDHICSNRSVCSMNMETVQVHRIAEKIMYVPKFGNYFRFYES